MGLLGLWDHPALFPWLLRACIYFDYKLLGTSYVAVCACLQQPYASSDSSAASQINLRAQNCTFDGISCSME